MEPRRFGEFLQNSLSSRQIRPNSKCRIRALCEICDFRMRDRSRIVPFWRGTVCTVRTFNPLHFKIRNSCSMRNLCLLYKRQVYALCPSGVVQFAQFEHSISRNSCSMRDLCLSYERQVYALCPSPVVQFTKSQICLSRVSIYSLHICAPHLAHLYNP